MRIRDTLQLVGKVQAPQKKLSSPTASLKICTLLHDEYCYSKTYCLQNLISILMPCYRATAIRCMILEKKLYSSIVKRKYSKFRQNRNGAGLFEYTALQLELAEISKKGFHVSFLVLAGYSRKTASLHRRSCPCNTSPRAAAG